MSSASLYRRRGQTRETAISPTSFHAGPYDTGQWYHVVGVYDGRITRLYINSQLVLEGKNQTSEINYPDHALFVIGKLDEIRLYDHALTEEEVLRNLSAEGLSVETAGKLAAVWGRIKREIR